MRERLAQYWSRLSNAAWLPYAMAAFVVFWALWPVPFQLPIGQDHAHHYLATQIFVDDLVLKGHWTGWTHRVGTGLPYGDVYGTLVYFVTGLLRIVTFGAVPMKASYSFGILLVWLVPALAIAAWARRLGAGPLAAVLAVAAFVLDPGADREGGWLYSMFHAVWPQLFATGMWLWAMITLFRLAEKTTFRRLAVAIVVTGTSVWAHPMNALNLAVTAPLALFVLAWARDRDGPAKTPWIVLALVGGACVGFGWFSHLMAAAESMSAFSAYGTPFPDFSEGLLRGEPFENALPLVGVVGLLGVFAAIAGRRAEGAFSLLVVAAMVLLASMHVFAWFDIGLSEHNRLIMYRRFIMTAKPVWFAMVGLGATAVWTGAMALRRDDSPAGLAGVAALFFIGVAWLGAGALVQGPAARPLTAQAAGLDDDIAELTELLRSVDVGELKRVGILHARGETGAYGLFAIADAGLDYVQNRGVPCHALEWDNAPKTVAQMARLGATHVITRSDRAESGTKLVGKAGHFRLYKITVKVQPPIWVEGPGKAEIEGWDSMDIRVALTGIKPASRLVVGMAPYPKWSAFLGGSELTLRSAKRHGLAVMSVSGLSEGTLELKFRDSPFEKSFFALMLLVFAGCLGCFVAGDRELPALEGRRQLIRSVVLATLVTGTVGVAMVLWWGGRSALERQYPGPVEVLHRQSPKFTYEPDPYCVRAFSRNPRVDCRESDLTPRVVVAPRKGKRMASCLRFGVPDKGSAELRFEAPAAARKVRGRLHVLDGRLRATLSSGKSDEKLRDGSPFALDVTDGEVRLLVTNRGSTGSACLELVATER